MNRESMQNKFAKRVKRAVAVNIDCGYSLILKATANYNEKPFLIPTTNEGYIRIFSECETLARENGECTLSLCYKSSVDDAVRELDSAYNVDFYFERQRLTLAYGYKYESIERMDKLMDKC